MSTPEDILAVGALADPTRRALYEFVVHERDAVGREKAAEAVGIPLHRAKFHLDKLVDEGLLETEYRRLGERQGPGAGRPSKLYRRAPGEVSVSLPGRNYDLVGGILAQAIETAGTTPGFDAALKTVAHRQGEVDAAREREGAGAGDRELPAVAAALAKRGYEPFEEEGDLRLANCPFDRLAQAHTDLVCGVNEAYVEGVIEGVGASGCHASLDPEEGFCCVRVTEETAASDEAPPRAAG